MTPEQNDRLRPVYNKLFEVVVVDCDPRNWTGAGKPSKDLTPKERGDATWCRKQAMASLSLLAKMQWMIDSPAEGFDPEELIAAAEAEAKKLLDKVSLGGR